MQDDMRVASVADTAMDLLAMGSDIKQYLLHRKPGLVKERPGERVTWFHIRRIPTSVYNRHVRAAVGESDRKQRAFQVGVVRVEHFHNPDTGRVETIEGTGRLRSATGDVAVWTDEEMEMFAPAFVDEIGGLAEQHSFLPRGSEVFFQPQPMSVYALALRNFHLAEQTRAERSAQSTGRPAPSTPATTPGDGYAAATSATATASATEPEAASSAKPTTTSTPSSD